LSPESKQPQRQLSPLSWKIPVPIDDSLRISDGVADPIKPPLACGDLSVTFAHAVGAPIRVHAWKQGFIDETLMLKLLHREPAFELQQHETGLL